MFAAPAFPRIPLFGGETSAQHDESSVSDKASVAEAPPVVPFDTLVLSAEKMKSESAETYKRNATSIAKYDTVVASIDSEDAREFLAALVFLGTRSTILKKKHAKSLKLF